MSVTGLLCGLLLCVAAGSALAQTAAPQTAAPQGAAAARASAAPAPAPAAIPFKRDGATPAGGWAGGATSVVLVSLAAIGAVLYLRRRLNLDGAGIGAPRLAKVLETQRLGPRGLLSVIEFGGQQHLVLQGEHGVSCLATLDAGEPKGERQ